jgi:predicted MFS family arabinose efflux permease
VLGLIAASVVAWALFAVRLLTAAEPFVPLAVMSNPVVATGTASNFFVVGAMVALSIYIPVYFEAVVGLSASQSGLALLALTGGTVTGAQIAGRIMTWTPHYKRGPSFGLALSTAVTAVLAFASSSLPFWLFDTLLAIAGVGIGTIFPVTTISIQNAVAPHQLGTATAAFNFFRSLGSAILVAVFGAIFLSSLGFGDRRIGSIAALVAEAAKNGTPIAPVFDLIFGAASLTLGLGLIFFLLMEEKPLRGRN